MQIDRSEQDLLERCSNGDRQAFSLLYTQYLQPLYRHTYLFLRCRDKSEGIVQDVFIKLWENRSCFSNINSFKPFVYHMAKNMVLDHIRRVGTEEKVMNRMKSLSETNERTSEDLMIYKDYLGIANEAIDQLTEKRKAIFLMRTQQDLSIDEIAAYLHISRSVVKKQLYTSVSLVRAHIEKHAQLSSGIYIIVSLFY